MTRSWKIGYLFLNWTPRSGKRTDPPITIQWYRHNKSVYVYGITIGWLNLKYL